MDETDMVELQTPDKEILKPETLKRYEAMADIARTYYLITAETGFGSGNTELYDNSGWIFEKMGNRWENKLRNFFTKTVENDETFKNHVAYSMASGGKESDARKLKNKKTRDSDFHNFIHKGMAEWELQQGNPFKAFERSLKINNVHSSLNAWGKIIEASSSNERDTIWPQIEVRLGEIADKMNIYNSGDLEYVIDNLVRASCNIGDLPQATRILELVGDYTNRLAEDDRDMDQPQNPRARACAEVGKAWARIGDFEKARKWLKKGEVYKTLEKQLTMCLSDWGTVPAVVMIERFKNLEQTDQVDVSDYRWRTESWFESGRMEDAREWWNWVTTNPHFLELVENKELKEGDFLYLWGQAKLLGDNVSESIFLKGLEAKLTNQNKEKSYTLSEIDIDKAQKADRLGNVLKRDKYLDLAWTHLNVTRENLQWRTKEIEKVLVELVNAGSWQRLRQNLDEISTVAKAQQVETKSNVGLLLLKYKLLVFENEYGKFSDQTVDFRAWGEKIHIEGWQETFGDMASILIEDKNDLENFIAEFTPEEKILSKLKIADIGHELNIQSEAFQTVDLDWVRRQLKENIGEPGVIRRGIVNLALEHVNRFGDSQDKDYILKLIKVRENWWNEKNDNLRSDMLKANKVWLSNYTRINQREKSKLFHEAIKMTEERWGVGDTEVLNLAVDILANSKEEKGPEWIVNWIAGHTADLTDSNVELVKARLGFLQAGLDANIEGVNFVAYQLMGEDVFDFNQTENVLERLVENRFLERGVLEWWKQFSRNEPAASIRQKVLKEIGFLISQDIYPHREVLEKFFDEKWPGEESRKLTIEEKISLNRESSKNYIKSFQEVFSRDANPALIESIQGSDGVRCLIGSVYGEPVVLVQNFETEAVPVDGHHEILNSWANGSKVKTGFHDEAIQRFIGKLVDGGELPVEHFLRGFLTVNNKKELVLRADAGFQQSSVSSRAELIPKVADTAKNFGIDVLEEIPDNEYAELQRLGFMRGVVKNLTKIVMDNLGENDAARFQNLARRYYVEREFDESSKSYGKLKLYSKLKEYLDLIDYHRKQKKSTT